MQLSNERQHYCGLFSGLLSIRSIQREGNGSLTTVPDVRAGSDPKQSKQLNKPVPAKTAMMGRGRGEKVLNAVITLSNSKENTFCDFLGYFE